MSIGKQVSETIDKMESADPEGALFAICAAIEATATKEFSKAGRSSYKAFIHQNLALITDIAFGGRRILNIHVAYDHPKVKKTPEGLCSFQELLYHAVRCGLYHESGLPEDIRFTDEDKFKVDNGVVVLPSSLIYGLIMAVVVSPVNSSESSPKMGMLNLGSFPIPISKLWGRRAEILWLLDAMAELQRLQSEANATGA